MHNSAVSKGSLYTREAEIVFASVAAGHLTQGSVEEFYDLFCEEVAKLDFAQGVVVCAVGIVVRLLGGRQPYGVRVDQDVQG